MFLQYRGTPTLGVAATKLTTIGGAYVTKVESRVVAAESRPRRESNRRKQLARTEDGRAQILQAREKVARALRQDSGLALLALRIAAGLTQAELAARSGLLQPHVSRIESGKVANPDRATVLKLSSALGVTQEVFEQALRGTLAHDSHS